MKKLLFALPLSALFFLFGCGGGGPSGAGGGGGGGGTGSFSNASLSGSYVYTISGFDLNTNNPYREAGVFTVDGNGNVTSGTDDFTEGASGISTSTSTGTYAISGDGTGTLSLIFDGVSSNNLNFYITLASGSKFYLVEADALNAYGVAEQQDATAASTTPSGSYAFRIHPVGAALGLNSMVGQMIVSSGVVSGSADVIQGGSFDNGTGAPLAITTGSLTAPSTTAGSTGRGSGSFADSLGTTSFNYYIVDSNNIRFLLNEATAVGIGRAALQTGAPFTTASFTGGYAFGSRGDDAVGGTLNYNDVATVGQLVVSNGAVTGGIYDSVQAGAQVGVGAPLTGGAYSVQTNGRVAVTLAPGIGTTTEQVYWLVSPSLAYFISDDTTKAEDGIAQLQSTTSFSNASLSGQYAFFMDGLNFAAEAYVDRVGWINVDGNGNLTLFQSELDNGTLTNNGKFSGTYNTVAANGRATATVNGISAAPSDITFYLVSPTEAYILQSGASTGYMIIGDMNLQ
jgi:hypothetical protein